MFRTGSGAFCYSFWPTHDNTLPGYPNNPRPAGNGKRYRISVEGPKFLAPSYVVGPRTVPAEEAASCVVGNLDRPDRLS